MCSCESGLRLFGQGKCLPEHGTVTTNILMVSTTKHFIFQRTNVALQRSVVGIGDMRRTGVDVSIFFAIDAAIAKTPADFGSSLRCLRKPYAVLSSKIPKSHTSQTGSTCKHPRGRGDLPRTRLGRFETLVRAPLSSSCAWALCPVGT